MDAPSITSESLNESISDFSHFNLRNIKLSFLAGLLLFIVCIPYLCSKKSNYQSNIAVQRLLKVVRVCIIFVVVLLAILFYFSINLGIPTIRDTTTNYGYSNSTWNYGYGRPVVGIILISFGYIGNLSIYFRLLCILGCLESLCFDVISSVQLSEFIASTDPNIAHAHNYSIDQLYMLYWRDIISVGFSTTIIYLVAYMNTLIGWFGNNYISYVKVEGGEYDHEAVMRRHLHLGTRKLSVKTGKHQNHSKAISDSCDDAIETL